MKEAVWDVENLKEGNELSGHDDLALDVLLEAGADVDRFWEWSGEYSDNWYYKGLSWLAEKASTWPLPMTWLDYAYYCHSELFRTLDRYSTRSETEITRAGICTAASQSTADLCQYFQSRPPWDPESLKQILECVLFELCCFGRRLDELDTIQNLINYGVDVRVPSMSESDRVTTSFLLYRLLNTVRSHGSNSGFKIVVEHLLQAGATIDSNILDAAVQ